MISAHAAAAASIRIAAADSNKKRGMCDRNFLHSVPRFLHMLMSLPHEGICAMHSHGFSSPAGESGSGVAVVKTSKWVRSSVG